MKDSVWKGVEKLQTALTSLDPNQQAAEEKIRTMFREMKLLLEQREASLIG